VGFSHSDSSSHVLPNYNRQDVDLYELTGDPELDDAFREYKATAKLCTPRLCTIDGSGHVTGTATGAAGGTPRYYMDSSRPAQTIWFPAGSRDDQSEPAAPSGVATGSRVWVSWHYGRLIIVSGGGGSLTPRILYDDVAPGDTDKNAWPVKDDMTADTAADKVLVQNVFPGTFRGYGDVHTGYDATTAAKVWTSPGPDGKEHIVYGKGLAKLCRAVAKAAISGATGTVDAVTVMDDGQSPVVDATTELSVNNPWNFYLADDALCQLTRNGSGWDITNVAMVAETFETEEQVTGLTFQGKHREIRVNPTGAESGWTTWHTGTACP